MITKTLKCAGGMTRYCYDMMLKMSVHRKAMYFLFAISFIESSFFPIPPDVMIIPMVLAAPLRAWRIAFVATIASVLGGWFGYFIGFELFDLIAHPLLEFYGYMAQFDEFKHYYNDYGAWIVFGAGLTPFPYKVVTITSGVVELDFWVFTAASIVARGMRFYFIAWLLKKYGQPIKGFVEKHLGKLTIWFFILLIGSFYAIKFIG